MIATSSTMENSSTIQVLNFIIYISALLSLFGSGFVLYMFITVKHLRTIAFKLVAILSTFDFMMILNLLGSLYFWNNVKDEDFICGFSFFINLFFTLGGIVTTCMIAWAVYLTIIKKVIDIDMYMYSFLIVILGIPMILALLPTLFKVYGD